MEPVKYTAKEREEDMAELREAMTEDERKKADEQEQNEMAELEAAIAEDRVWYEVMRYRMRSHCILVWPIIIVANIALLIMFLVVGGHKATNPYSTVVFWVCFFGDSAMCIQYFKQHMFDKYRHLYKFIAVH